MRNTVGPERTLLLVEDEAIIALNQREQLERHGFAVVVASSGAAAVDTLRRDPSIDLVLMDIDLGPGMDGTAAAREILALRSVPIVFLTSHGDPEYVNRVREITSFGYVLKSSGEFVLVQSIEMAFSLWDSQRQLSREIERYRSIVETEFRSIYDQSDEAIAMWDRNGRVVRVNAAGARIFGATPEELEGSMIGDIFPEPSVRQAREAFRSVFENGRPRNAEWRTTINGEEERWYLVHTEPIHSPDGQVTAVITFSTDITRYKQLELELEAAVARLEATFEAIPDLFFEIDSEYRFRDYRPRSSSHFYLPPEGFIGKRMDEVLPESAVAPFYRAAEAVLAGDAPTSFDYTLPDAGGAGPRYFRGALSLISDGSEPRFVLLIHEVTDFVSTQRRLEEAVEMNQGLLREIHHRVKNNLAIVSSLIALKGRAHPDLDLSDLQNQVEAVRFVHEQLQSGNSSDAVDLRRYLRDLLEQLFTAATLNDVELELDLPELELATSKAVPLGLLVNELATNAIKHSFLGERVYLFRLTAAVEGGSLVVKVFNSGAPFPEGIDLENGPGLGMQLVNGLVEQLGGSLRLVRSPHPEFTITIPLNG